jgi:hypothetical protein
MGLPGCPVTLVISYQPTVCNNPRRAKISTITWQMPDILQLGLFISLPHISTKLGHHQGVHIFLKGINPLVPSDPYTGRTAQLTSRRCLLNTYSTNIRTEYFKRAA